MLVFQKERAPKNKLSAYSLRRSIEWDQQVLTSIKTLGSASRSRTFVFMITALKILLHLDTGQRDIRIGTLVAGRYSKESEDIIAIV